MKIEEIEKIILIFPDSEIKKTIVDKFNIVKNYTNEILDFPLQRLMQEDCLDNYLSSILFLKVHNVYYNKLLYHKIQQFRLDKTILKTLDDTTFNQPYTKQIQTELFETLIKFSIIDFSIVGVSTDTIYTELLTNLYKLMYNTIMSKENLRNIIIEINKLCDYSVSEQVMCEKNACLLHSTICIKILTVNKIDIFTLTEEQRYVLAERLWDYYKSFINTCSTDIGNNNDEDIN